MRLTLVISSLGLGGAEAAATTMVNHWTERGVAVTVLTLDDGSEAPFRALHTDVVHRPLGLAEPSRSRREAIARNVARVTALRRAIRESAATVVLSFMDTVNVLVLMATRGLGVPVVVAERTAPDQQRVGLAWSLLRRLTYRAASAVVVQTPGAAAHAPFARSWVVVIPNPVPRHPAAPRPSLARVHRIVAAGRLSREKGFDLLLAAVAQQRGPLAGWSVVIHGDGAERDRLLQQRDDLGVTELVDFPGRTATLHDVLATASMFVLPSRYEGFPNALCEAMAAGCAVVAFDCPHGPGAIIRDGVDGVLVPPGDVAALGQAVAALANDEARRERLGRRAREVCDRFAQDVVMSEWDRLLDRVARAS